MMSDAELVKCARTCSKGCCEGCPLEYEDERIVGSVTCVDFVLGHIADCVEEKDARIAAQGAIIEDKDRKIAEIAEQNEELRRRVDAQSAFLEDKNRCIVSITAALTKQIEEKNRRIAELSALLEDGYDSRGKTWK